MQRAQKFRMIGLAGTALLAIAVPLGAAMAGPVGTSAPETGSGEAAKAENSSTAETEDTSENGSKPGNRAATGAKRPAGSPPAPACRTSPAAPPAAAPNSRLPRGSRPRPACSPRRA